MSAGRMARGSIALWLVPREGGHRDPRAEAAELDADAREQMDALRTPAARDARLLSRAWLSRVLRVHFGPHSASWSVGVDCSGRAVLRGAPSGLAVAFAHGSHMIAIAIGYECGARLGIDLEDRLDGDDPLLAPVMLSPAELERYHCLATGERRRRFLLLRWVAKEAYAKALGKGLALQFEAIEMVESAIDRFDVLDPYARDGVQWQARLIEPDEDTAVAVAWAPSDGQPVELSVYGARDLAPESGGEALLAGPS